MLQQKGYKYRIYPNRKQEKQISFFSDAAAMSITTVCHTGKIPMIQRNGTPHNTSACVGSHPCGTLRKHLG